MAIANCTDDDVDFRTEPPVDDDKKGKQGGRRNEEKEFKTILSGYFEDQDLQKDEKVIFRDVKWELTVVVPGDKGKVVLAQQPIVEILLPQE